MRQMPDAMGESAGKRYPHLLRLLDKSTDEVVEFAAANTTFSPQELKSAIAVVAKAMAYFCAEGYTVHLDELGTFRAKLRLRPDAPEEHEQDATRRNGASVEVGGYQFRPDKELIFQTNIRGQFERISDRRWRRSKPLPEEERRERLREFLARNTVATVGDYCRLSGLLHTAAAAELRRIAAEPDSFLARYGYRATLVYMLRREEPAESGE